MKRLAAVLLSVLTLGCTTTETDPSTLYTVPLYRTRIDFQPLDRTELETQLSYERTVYQKRKDQLEDQLGGVQAQRKVLYTEIEGKLGQVGDCRHQPHCLDQLARGTIPRFENYTQLMLGLKELDRQAGELQNQLELLERRLDLRERALYNRFLVNEVLLAKWEHPRMNDLIVHSLEAYPTRRELSHRLARLSDPDVVPELYGDINFRMMGHPVDEAAVIATFDVRVHPNPQNPNDPTRYLVTYLVNTHQRDPVYYSKGFLKSWAAQMGEPNLRRLKEQVYCGLYAIAGPTLVTRLHASKVKPCTPTRLRYQQESYTVFKDRFQPEAWFLPIAFTEATDKR